MKETGKFRILSTACSDQQEADRIARALVESELAACVNIIPGARSIYRWKGKVEATDEVLLLIKTEERLAGEVEKTITALHSYELPEILALKVTGGSERYLDWLQTSLR